MARSSHQQKKVLARLRHATFTRQEGSAISASLTQMAFSQYYGPQCRTCLLGIDINLVNREFEQHVAADVCHNAQQHEANNRQQSQHTWEDITNAIQYCVWPLMLTDKHKLRQRLVFIVPTKWHGSWYVKYINYRRRLNKSSRGEYGDAERRQTHKKVVSGHTWRDWWKPVQQIHKRRAWQDNGTTKTRKQRK